MAAIIEDYLSLILMQLAGHLNAGPASDPNTRAMAQAMLDVPVGAVLAADAAANTNALATSLSLGKAAISYVIKALGIVPTAALVANVNDYATVTFEATDGAGTAVSVGTILTNATNWVANVPVAATLGTNLIIPAGGTLTVKHVKTGDGVSIPLRTVYARLRRYEA
jgi:hypothetical protein